MSRIHGKATLFKVTLVVIHVTWLGERLHRLAEHGLDRRVGPSSGAMALPTRDES
jgi:hypothetical protein